MKRILVAGFHHETNTFTATKTDYAAFERGGMFPAMVRADDVFSLRDVNIPIGGFIQAMETERVALESVIWAGATPSGLVTAEAFEAIAGEIVDAATRRAVDGVYLDLHGAMASENFDDGEGELICRLRRAVGPEIPIVASLDLHANVTARMLDGANALAAYRTYPHEDMALTGARAAAAMKRMVFNGERFHRSARRLPFLIPVNAMCTLVDPAKDAYRRLEGMETHPVVSLSLALGFPASDFPECGPVVWGYGLDAHATNRTVDALFDAIVQTESQWDQYLWAPEDAVREAQRLARRSSGPIIIADTQDNAGGGADSDTTGMLRALLECGAENAALGLVADAEAAAAAHRAGVGKTLELSLGGKSGVAGDAPFKGSFRVEQLSDGRCQFGGPMLTGKIADHGPSARLSIGGVQVVVTTWKDQLMDRNQYRMAGVRPEDMSILVNKSSVHFRADFEPIASAILVARAPGVLLADPAELPWRRLPGELRLKPNGPRFSDLRQP